MENNLLIIFIILNILNVIIQTVKSLCTINGGKIVAAVANAVAYGFYTIVIIYMVCDLPLATKVVIVAICNFVGVFFVKMLEEKSRKETWEANKDAKAGDTINVKEVKNNYFAGNFGVEVTGNVGAASWKVKPDLSSNTKKDAEKTTFKISFETGINF